MFHDICKLNKFNIFSDVITSLFFLGNSTYLAFIFGLYSYIINSNIKKELLIYLINSTVISFYFIYFSIVKIQVYSEEGEMQVFSMYTYCQFYRKTRGIYMISYMFQYFLSIYLLVFSNIYNFNEHNQINYENEAKYLIAEFIIISTSVYIHILAFLTKTIFIPYFIKCRCFINKRNFIRSLQSKNIPHECPICLEVGLTNKKVTKCNHYFHEECLIILYEMNNDSVKCPICREIIN